MTQRPLTSAEAECLHKELKTTPNILGYTVKELMRFSEVFVAEENGEFAGACLSKDLRFGWTDIAVLYVLPAFRGRGFGGQLYAAAWRRAADRGRHIVTLSRSPEVIGLMQKSGMTTAANFWHAPLALHLHMNCHMSSWYRTREAIRKARQLRISGKLLCGTWKNVRQPSENSTTKI